MINKNGFIKRKILKQIDKWFNSKTNNALLIDGARQIGKTTAIREYFSSNKIDYVELNLIENNNVRLAFDESNDYEQLMLRIKLLANRPITNNTVLFIDEIQASPNSYTKIKFLVEKSSYKFIFSGSLLGVNLHNIISFPVGFLDVVRMYPLDFEEFITALGVSDEIIKVLKESYITLKPVDEIVHLKLLELFNLYLIVGGMPEAVKTYIITNDINEVNKVLNKLDNNYKFDIAQYNSNERLLIQDIYDLIPSELNSANKRFILKKLNEKARFYTYESSFAWLKNSGVGLFVHNVDNPTYPLLASKERTLFKLFQSDIGILTYKLFNGNQLVILNGETKLNYGAIYENVVANELIAHGFELYYNNDKKRGEIDFLIEKDNKVIPIEVKSGKDYKRHCALNNLLENPDFNIDYGYVFCHSNVKVSNKKVYLPIYMIMFLTNITEDKKQIVKIDINNLK